MTVEKKSLFKLVAAAWGLAVVANESRLRNQRASTPTLPMQPPWEAQVRHLLPAPRPTCPGDGATEHRLRGPGGQPDPAELEQR